MQNDYLPCPQASCGSRLVYLDQLVLIFTSRHIWWCWTFTSFSQLECMVLDTVRFIVHTIITDFYSLYLQFITDQILMECLSLPFRLILDHTISIRFSFRHSGGMLTQFYALCFSYRPCGSVLIGHCPGKSGWGCLKYLLI